MKTQVEVDETVLQQIFEVSEIDSAQKAVDMALELLLFRMRAQRRVQEFGDKLPWGWGEEETESDA
ncbi:MAG: hypothetical protein AAF752_07200 [Bacteroidota bacterium]